MESGGITRVAAPTAAEARRMIETSLTPIIFEGMLKGWPSASWTPSHLAASFPHLHTRVRIQQRGDGKSCLEGACSYESATFAEFYEWQRVAASVVAEGGEERSPKRARRGCGSLAGYPAASHWGYADYKRVGEVFGASDAEQPNMFRWTRFGLSGIEATDDAHTTMWWGNEGCRSQLHYDAYGSNLHAQLSGAKEWILFPPRDSALLRPQRTPYEESSIFSALNVRDPTVLPQLTRSGAQPLRFVLQKGEVLFLPRHWWHDVRIVEGAAVSANVWLPRVEDDAERVREGLVRLLVCAVMRGVPSQRERRGEDDGEVPWLSPTEESYGAAEDAALLHAQLAKLRASWQDRSPTELRATIARAISTEGCLDAVVSDLMR